MISGQYIFDSAEPYYSGFGDMLDGMGYRSGSGYNGPIDADYVNFSNFYYDKAEVKALFDNLRSI